MLASLRDSIRAGFASRDSKTIQEAVAAKHLAVKGLAAGQIDRDAYKITFVGTRDSVDRDSERILPRAFEKDFGHYLQNPVVLFNHNIREPAVGRMDDYEITDKEILLRVKFAVDENPMAALLWRLYSADPPYMRMVSMAFLALEATDKPEMKLAGQKKLTYTRVEMLELSFVNIGANRYALSMLSKEFGIDAATDPILKGAYEHFKRGINEEVTHTMREHSRKVVVFQKGMGFGERVSVLMEGDPDREGTIAKIADAAHLTPAEVTGVLSGNESGLLSRQIEGFAEVLDIEPALLTKGVSVNNFSEHPSEGVQTSETDTLKEKYYYGRAFALKPAGSFEKIRGKVCAALETYLPLKLPSFKRYNYVDFDVVGTFTDHVIVCCYNYDNAFEKTYQIDYTFNDENQVVFADEMVEVEQQFVTVSS